MTHFRLSLRALTEGGPHWMNVSVVHKEGYRFPRGWARRILSADGTLAHPTLSVIVQQCLSTDGVCVPYIKWQAAQADAEDDAEVEIREVEKEGADDRD